MPALKIKDKDGNWIPLPTIKGDKGDSGAPIATTYTPDGGADGMNYAADVPGMKELQNGQTIVIVPHVNYNPGHYLSLSVNGGTAKDIYRLASDATTSDVPDGMITKDIPIMLNYDESSSSWYIWGYFEPVATDISGIGRVANGFTGLSTVPAGSYLVGNDTKSMVAKTPADVAADVAPFIPSGGKRVARFTVGTSTSGWTAKDCDYLCDGTDDQVEINAAIQALPTTGGEVVILDGTYNIMARIDVNKGFTTLTGNGQSTVFKRMWNSSIFEGIIHVTSNGNVIQKLMVDGNKNTYASPNNYGIYLISSSNNAITGNTCNSSYSGIHLSSSSNNNTVTWNTCNNSAIYSISLDSSSNNTVTGNRCKGNYGISLSSSSNNTVTLNMCSNNSSYGISLSSSSNNTVTGNTCNNNNYGIHLASSSNNTVTGNTCNNNRIHGIGMVYSSNNTVTGNTCVCGTGLASDYTSSQYTIRLLRTENNYNLIADNNIMGKNYTSDGGTGNTFVNNKYN